MSNKGQNINLSPSYNMDNQKDAAVELEHYEDAKVDATSDAQVKSVDAVNDPEQALQERRIVRKLDMTLMPMIWLLYLFNYLDRNNIAYVDKNIISFYYFMSCPHVLIHARN